MSTKDTKTAVNVLVVFYSRYGSTEHLALAAGLGAIQAEANIRLRRLPDRGAPDAIDADPLWRRNVDRMHRDYVTPRAADPVWADVIVLVSPVESAVEVEEYVASLPALGPMADKIAAPLAVASAGGTLRSLYAAAAGAGLMVVPAELDAGDLPASARAHGQRVVELARTFRSARLQPGLP